MSAPENPTGSAASSNREAAALQRGSEPTTDVGSAATDDLGRVLDALDRVEYYSRLLDGRDYDEARWREARESAVRMGRELDTLRGFYESTCADLLEHDKASETVRTTVERIRETANLAQEVFDAD